MKVCCSCKNCKVSHWNADNERSLSVNKKTCTKERSNLSTITLNGLRAREDGVKSLNGLSHITVTKNMLSYVKDSHKAYMEHIETERKKELKKRCSNAELEEMKKKKEEESRKVEKPKSSMKDLDARESRAEQILQSASGFLEEGIREWQKD